MDFVSGKKPRLFNEQTFPPWGYVTTIDSEPPDNGMVDMSFFAKYRYNDWKDVSLRIPVLPVHSWVPEDSRSRDQILQGFSVGQTEGAGNCM